MRFRPVIAGSDNGTTAVFSLYSSRSADSYRGTTAGNFPVGAVAFKAVDAVSLGDGWGDYTAAVRFFSLTTIPAGGLTANTQTIALIGQISRYADLPGCIATFKAVLTRRPD
jgi:hypothetical protein